MNVGEGHKSTARVEVDLGPNLEVDLGPSLGPILGAGLGIEQEPTVKVVPVLTLEMCSPSLQMNPQIEG